MSQPDVDSVEYQFDRLLSRSDRFLQVWLAECKRKGIRVQQDVAETVLDFFTVLEETKKWRAAHSKIQWVPKRWKLTI